MKLGYVLATFPCVTETFILREILELRRQGHSIEIFALRRPAGVATREAPEPLGPVSYRAPALSAAAIRGQCHFLLRATGRYLRLLLSCVLGGRVPGTMPVRIRRLLTAAQFALGAERCGVEHIHAHFAFVPADVALLMSGLLGLPFSVSAHAWDVYAQRREDLAARTRDASVVVTCTDHARTHLAGQIPNMPPSRIVTVRHGLTPSRFAGAASDEPTVLAVGRLEEKKGFRYLVRACARLREHVGGVACLIVGEGRERPALEQEAERLGVRDHVSFVGELTHSELPPVYARAAVFAAPSVVAADGDRDGLPNVILEAMAAGLPVVATDASAADEAVVDGLTGYIVPAGDETALAERLQRLLVDPGLRRRMGEAGRKRVAAAFDISENARNLARVFYDTRKRHG